MARLCDAKNSFSSSSATKQTGLLGRFLWGIDFFAFPLYHRRENIKKTE